MPPLSPIGPLPALRGAVAFRARSVREVTLVASPALGARERGGLATFPCPAPVLAVPSAAGLAPVPLCRCDEGRFSVDLQAFGVESPAVLLTMFLRREEFQVRRVVVERVVIYVMDVHSLRNRAVSIGVDVAMKIAASATARRLVVNALGPFFTSGIPLVRDALVPNLNWWLHGPILPDALLLAFYAAGRTRVRWM